MYKFLDDLMDFIDESNLINVKIGVDKEENIFVKSLNKEKLEMIRNRFEDKCIFDEKNNVCVFNKHILLHE